MRYPWDFANNRQEIEWLRGEVERLEKDLAFMRSERDRFRDALEELREKGVIADTTSS
jgi:hypothetical protein